MLQLHKRVALAGLWLTLVGCASVDVSRYESSDTLALFTSVDEASSYAHARLSARSELAKYVRRVRPSSPVEGVLEEVTVYGIKASETPTPDVGEGELLQSITNNQEAHVDEGGIVKRIGEYMLVMRRGRLYSIRVGHSLVKVDDVGIQPATWRHDAWYDELLVHNDRILVVGFSYDYDATEFVFFTIDEAGKLRREGAQLLSSSDYYSSGNYGSRLVDGKLVFHLERTIADDAHHRSSGEESGGPFSAVVASVDDFGSLSELYPLFGQHEVYSPIISGYDLGLTTVAVCPLEDATLACSATGLMGGEVAGHYVSADAYYFWMSGESWNLELERLSRAELKRLAKSRAREQEQHLVSAIYRVPLNGGPVGVVKLRGEPIDQFSFKKTEHDLIVLGREPSGPVDWFDPSYSSGKTFVTAIPLASFEGGVAQHPETSLHYLPAAGKGVHVNRFVGSKLIYGIGRSSDDCCPSTSLFVIEPGSPPAVAEATLDIEAEQIHPVGEGGLIIGYDQSDALVYATLDLDRVLLADRLTEPYDELAESRSHGFYYKAMASGGVFGVPVVNKSDDTPDYKTVDGVAYVREAVADVAFTRLNQNLTMDRLGPLSGDRATRWTRESDCDVSCEDWYGSVRPIFWGQRIFALTNYELIEGHLVDGRIVEKQRINFGPGAGTP